MSHSLTLVIDFETANTQATSACAIGMVVIENQKIIHTESLKIRPPTDRFMFSYIHGITWNEVKNEPTFDEQWDLKLKQWFDRADTLVAHNIGFDSRVLKATADHYQIAVPELKKTCTVQIARNDLSIKPANLANVCQVLGIKLNHHEAMSDAMASAYIYLYHQTGIEYWKTDKTRKVAAPGPLEIDIEKMGALNSEKSLALMKKLLKSPKSRSK